MNDEHPLLLELTNLRRTAARFQHEAHETAVKLQQHVLKTSHVHEHAIALEKENTRLQEELAFLRSHPDVAPHSAVVQVQELTLALRRVSEKIELTERTLLERTNELASARNELVKTRHDMDGAYELASRMRAREEESKERERELGIRMRASEEQRKMADLVVQEYADLVRSLEGRRSVNHVVSTPGPDGSVSALILATNLQDGRLELQKLFAEFCDETTKREAVIMDLRGQVSTLQVALEAERKASLHDRSLLSQAQTELCKLNLEDQAAAKMVSRYMRFSQSSINSLQQQIDTTKARHASTISTLQFQLSQAQSLLASERAQSARLQEALDALCEDVVREAYGRRREVALRLALLSREETLAEGIRRLARRARELYERCYSDASQVPDDVAQGPSPPSPSTDANVRAAFRRVVHDIESILHSLQDDVVPSDGIEVSGSLARILLAQEAVDALRADLQDELGKRVQAIRRCEELISRQDDRLTPEISQVDDKSSGALDYRDVGRGGPLTDDNDAIQDSRFHVSDTNTPYEAINDDPFVSSSGITEESVDLIDPSGPAKGPSTEPLDQAAMNQHVDPNSPVPQDDRLLESSIHISSDDELALSQEKSPAESVERPIETPGLPLSEELAVVNTTSGHGTDVQHEDTVAIRTPTTTEVSPGELVPYSTSNSSPVPPSPQTPSSLTLSTTFHKRQPDETSALLSSLDATKYRYDTLQRAFRDCSLALKELKRTLAVPPPTPNQTYEHCQAALLRIDDYTEDARVELEIRIADEELMARGFETLLTVPGALNGPDELAEVEENARRFVDGTDESVSRAVEKFERKLDDVQHDVAVIKRVVHGLSFQEDNHGDNKGAGWSSWTTGLLGTGSSPSRSPTPVLTFGSVMTSPRLRRESSFQQLHSPGHKSPDPPSGSLLMDLDLRIPMPPAATTNYANLGIGRAPESRPRTISTMYSVGLGGRSSSLTLGIGLGGGLSSPSKNRLSRPSVSRFASAPLVDDTLGSAATVNRSDTSDIHDHSDVE